MRSTRVRKPLFKYETLTDTKVLLGGSRIPFFAPNFETMRKDNERKNKKKKSSKIHRFFFKPNIINSKQSLENK